VGGIVSPGKKRAGERRSSRRETSPPGWPHDFHPSPPALFFKKSDRWCVRYIGYRSGGVTLIWVRAIQRVLGTSSDWALVRCRATDGLRDLPSPPRRGGDRPGSKREPTRMTDPRAERTELRESLTSGGQRVSAVVALTILEVIQASDRPFEVFEEEDTSITMPRRLGLSDVVERRIRNYRDESKRGSKISEEEFSDLVRLVVRRPDARAVFLECGARLAGKPPRQSKILPRKVGFALAKRKVGKTLRALFGRRVGGFSDAGFVLEGRSLLFIQSDAGGDACSIVSGLCSATLGGSVQDPPTIAHIACEARGDAYCRWGVQ